jgi:hypothetical protein
MKQLKLKTDELGLTFTIKNLTATQMEILSELCALVRLDMQNDDMFTLASFFDENGFMGYQTVVATNNKNNKQFDDFTLELA